ncbi:MAG: PAS domain-containing protein [Syntrophomonadaceae bacterium]|nr:PAS domain-containing protein [Syntrophomonadaceae bacterium]MDD3022383.1 PAS domain-containing protein [Syntrophomonadaceae bacterium]
MPAGFPKTNQSAYEVLLHIKKAIDSSSNAISVNYINGDFYYLNNAFTQLFGYYLEEINAMQGLSELFVRSEVLAEIFSTMQNGNSWLGEVVMNKSTLDTFPVNLQIDPVRDEDGSLIAMIAIYTDITLQMEAERAFKKRILYENMLSMIAMHAVDPEKSGAFFSESISVLGETLDVSRVYIFQYSIKRDAYDNTYEWVANGISPQKEMLQNIPADDIPWWTEMLRNNHTIIYSDIADIPGETERELLQAQEIKSVLVVPFNVGKNYFGFLGFDECRYHRLWPMEDIDILTTVAQIFNWSLERGRVQRKLLANEEQLAVTLQSIGDGVITCNVNYQVILMNQAAEDITSWTAPEATGKNICDVLYLIDGSNQQEHSLLKQLIMNIIKKQYISNYPETFTLLTKDAARKIITCSGNTIKNRENRIIGLVLVLRDVTEEKRHEAQVALSQKLESIGQLAAGIAHEINTPMQYVGDNTQFLKEAFADFQSLLLDYRQLIASFEEGSNIEESIQIIHEHENASDLEYLLDEIPKAIEQSLSGIERVRKLVLTMKDFSHHQSGEKRFSDVNKGIENTVNISVNEWKYYADLKLELASDLPLLFCAIDEINQVVLNMIVNSSHAIQAAIEKSSYEKGCITIVTAQEYGNIKIMISDNGLGIPSSIIHRIYDHFFTTKKVGQGTGQGLAIAHDIIVTKHQGKIQVESTEGEGTCFTISLPVSSSPQKGVDG